MPSLYPEQIETNRLVLEQLCHDTVDVFEFYRCLSDHEANIEEVTKYTAGIDPHRTPKETNDYIDRAENSWNDNEKAWYIIRPREGEDGAGEIAGVALLETEWERRVGTLGIVLRKPFWGRGYSAERATALLKIAFDQLDFEIVTVTCETENENSKKAIEKYIETYGGQRDGLLRHYAVNSDGEPLDYHHYSILREQYRANSSEPKHRSRR